MENNKIELSGKVVRDFTVAYEAYGETFYEGKLEVKRYSGVPDILPVTISERIAIDIPRAGDELAVEGQIRTRNELSDGRSRLIISVFVTRLLVPVVDKNDVELTGRICKPPIYRMTPLGRELCDVLLAVNRGFNKSDYIPCIFWGRNAAYIKDFSTDVSIFLEGRLQSREYQKIIDGEPVKRVTYEVSGAKLAVLETNKDKLN